MATHYKTSSGGGPQLARGLGWFSVGLGLAEVLAPDAVARLAGVPEQKNLIRMLGMRELAHGVSIFAQPQSSVAVWSRVVGDAIDMACLGAAFTSPTTSKGRAALATAAVLGVTALDVVCAQQLSRDSRESAVRMHSITINRPIEDVYQFWRDFENLPRFMSHLESVRVFDDKRSHWVAKAPAGKSVEWDAQIMVDRPNEQISWCSLAGADVPNSGSVRFRNAPGGRGTEVHVELQYIPPAGLLGAGLAKLFGEEPGQQIKGDLYRFKQVMETGEVVRSDASIHKGMHPAFPPEGQAHYLESSYPQSQSAPGMY